MSSKVRRKPQKNSVRKANRKIKKHIAVCKSEMITVSLSLPLCHEDFEWIRNERGKYFFARLSQELQVHSYRDYARRNVRITPFHQSAFCSE